MRRASRLRATSAAAAAPNNKATGGAGTGVGLPLVPDEDDPLDEKPPVLPPVDPVELKPPVEDEKPLDEEEEEEEPPLDDWF